MSSSKNNSKNNKSNKIVENYSLPLYYGPTDISENEFKFRYGLWGGDGTRFDEHGSYLYWQMRNHGGRKVTGKSKEIEYVRNWGGPGRYDHTKFNISKPRIREAYLGKRNSANYCTECLCYGGGHTKYCSKYKTELKYSEKLKGYYTQYDEDLHSATDENDFKKRVNSAQNNVKSRMNNYFNKLDISSCGNRGKYPAFWNLKSFFNNGMKK